MTKVTKLGQWHLLEEIGKGGNGRVCRAQSDNCTAALKILHKRDRVQRFRDEVTAMNLLAGTQGVLPVLDSHIPEAPTQLDPAWFAMPLATRLEDALGDPPDPTEIVKAIRDISHVLIAVHSKGFSHRDIKPDNLFKYGDQWVVGDFGLVDFDGKDHKTAEGERIGPIYFIAPEMLLARQAEDGKAADVYSLAKTLWVLLTGFRFPVPGGYDAAMPICQLRSYLKLRHSIQLDKLIERCTAIDPKTRPTMQSFAEEVAGWLHIYEASGIVKDEAPLSMGSEWIEVLESSNCQDLARSTRATLYAETQADIEAFFTGMLPLYKQLTGIFQSAHLRDFEGPGPGRVFNPPGVLAWFPEKSAPDKRVGLEFRVWFTPDWQHLERRLVQALALIRLKVTPTTNGRDEELYRHEASFVIGGPAQLSFVERVEKEVLSSVSSCLEYARQRWSSLG